MQGAGEVILVRHARPVIVPETPAAAWLLADDAAGEIVRLAEALRPFGADGVVTSPEPKARWTAEVVARRLGLPLAEDPALAEQDARGVPYLSDADFLAAVEGHFRRPDEVVFGAESSADAARRLASGIEAARERHTRPIVVTHGRVLCGWLARALGIDPVPIWRSLRLPDALLVDLDRGRCERIEVAPIPVEHEASAHRGAQLRQNGG